MLSKIIVQSYHCWSESRNILIDTHLCEVDVDGLEELLNVEESVESVEERHEMDLTWANAWDDQTGKELDPKLVRKARLEEMEYVRKMGVYAAATREECRRETGHDPIKSRWIDINKGDDARPNYRSRWVAKQFKNC